MLRHPALHRRVVRRAGAAAVAVAAMLASGVAACPSLALFTAAATIPTTVGTAATFTPASINTGYDTMASAASVTIGWNPVAGTDTFDIYRCTPTSDGFCLTGTLIATRPGTATTYTDGGLDPATKYLYVVVANSGQRGTQVGSWMAWTRWPTPTNLRVTAVSVEGVTLAWDPVAGGPAYDIRRDGTLITSGVTGTTFEDRNPSRPVTWGGTYTYTVTAQSADTSSAQSAAVNATITVYAPETQAGSWTSTVNGVTVTWPVVPGATGYAVTRCATPAAVNKAFNKTVALTGTNWRANNYGLAFVTDGEARSNNDDFFLAADASTDVPYVTIDLGSVTPIDQVTVWHWFKDGRTYNNTKTQVSADGTTWTTIFDSAASGTYQETIQGKQVSFARQSIRYIRDYAGPSTMNQYGTWSEIQAFDSHDAVCDPATGAPGIAVPAGTTTLTDTVPDGTSWLYSATADTAAGRVQAGYWATSALPGVPTNLQAALIDRQHDQIAWDPVPGTGITYRIYRDGSPLAASVTATTYTDNDSSALNPGTTHTYTVEAVNAGGASGQSAPLTITLLP